MSSLKNDPNAQKWMAQWRHAAKELPKIRAKELRKLSDKDSFDLLHQHDVPEEDKYNNGLVIQQAWFSRFQILHLMKARKS